MEVAGGQLHETMSCARLFLYKTTSGSPSFLLELAVSPTSPKVRGPRTALSEVRLRAPRPVLRCTGGLGHLGNWGRGG